MISQPEKARRWHRRESYDEKCERRHETRETLRHRNNVTTCRRLGRGTEEPSQSPRQREFLRRRNLASDAGRTPPGQEPEARIPPDPCSRVEPRPPVLLQHPWSCPTFPPARSPLSLSIPLSISAEAIHRQGPSTNTQGTQTLTNPSAGVKDSSQQTDCGIAVLNKEMVQLSNYLKEALHRELLLKQKMVILQELFSTLLQASEKSWQVPESCTGWGEVLSWWDQARVQKQEHPKGLPFFLGAKLQLCLASVLYRLGDVTGFTCSAVTSQARHRPEPFPCKQRLALPLSLPSPFILARVEHKLRS